jgi:subtilisin family serine protease
VIKSFLIAGLIFCAALIAIPNPSAAQNALPPGAHAPGELLIAGKPGVTDTALENIYKAFGAQKIKTFPQIGVHHISVPAQALEQIEAALSKNPNVQFVEKNFVGQAEFIPNDPYYSSQWYLPKISAPAGWDLTTGSTNVTIAVLDSGVDPNHPEFSGRLVPGYNYVYNNTDTHDIYGHGTFCAGIAAAAGNSGQGIAGMAWQNLIMPIVIFNESGVGYYSWWISAIDFAADNGAKVISMSVAGSSYSSALQSAVDYAWNKGVVIVAAAANNSTSSPYYPAALNHVIAVSATDEYDNFASFSNYGNWITVSAPGTNIVSTTNGGGYSSGTGTSFSTPQVSGLAALLFSLNSGLTNTNVVDLIKNNADDLGSAGFDQYYGWGRINAYRTLSAVQSTSSISVAITSPSNGSTISGTVNVDVAASSTSGISQVELYVDGALYGATTVAPYSFPWNTNGMAGSHTITSKAYTPTGKSAASAPETVSISSPDVTPPTVQITTLTYDGRFLNVTGAATDTQTGVTRVELWLDGALKATDTSSPWTYKLNTRQLPKGSHTVQLKAYDGAGNMGLSSPATFTK